MASLACDAPFAAMETINSAHDLSQARVACVGVMLYAQKKLFFFFFFFFSPLILLPPVKHLFSCSVVALPF